MIPWFEFKTFEVFGVTFYTFGVLLALSIIGGLYLLDWRAKRTGLDPKAAEHLLYWVVFGGLYLGHVFSVFVYTPGKVWDDPLVLLRFWDGLSSIGGITAGMIIGILYLRRKKLPAVPYFDAFIFCFVPAWTLARLGCTLVHDHPGIQTDFFLAIQYPEAEGGPRHDLGFYEFLLSLGISIWYFIGRNRPHFAGYHAIAAALIYLPIRFLWDFLRAADEVYAGLTPAQWGIIGLFAWTLWIGHRWSRSGETIQTLPL